MFVIRNAAELSTTEPVRSALEAVLAMVRIRTGVAACPRGTNP